MEPLPAGPYRLILADPPWLFRVRSEKGKGRNPERHYACLSVEEIAALPVRDIAARDAILLLWATWPHLETALAVGRAWGFTYKTAFVWDKEINGTGYHFRGRTEPCLFLTRGAPGLPAVRDVPNLIRERRRRHSQKPEEQYRRIDRMWPHLDRRVELFARERRAGWDAWGLEVPALMLDLAG